MTVSYNEIRRLTSEYTLAMDAREQAYVMLTCCDDYDEYREAVKRKDKAWRDLVEARAQYALEQGLDR